MDNGYFKKQITVEKASRWRRELHKHPQPGWLEFYATGFVAEKLEQWGYDVQLGESIISADKRLFVPEQHVLEREYQLALQAGIDERYILPARSGLTGVVGTLHGKADGPVIAFRFDIDGLEIQETDDMAHIPNACGFASMHNGYAHMCGHDSHTSTGLILAEYLSKNREDIRGTVKFIFQPDEEKLSGAEAMVAAGVMEDVDIVVGGHVAANLWEIGQICLNVHNILSVSRSIVAFKGKATHSTGRPDQGHNALLGACTAVTNLHAISRHGKGVSMINVGKLEGGMSWNFIPDRAVLSLETRAASTEISEYLQSRVQAVISGAAVMYELEVNTTPIVNSGTCENSPEMITIGEQVAERIPELKVIPRVEINASENFVALAEAVKARGGKSLYVIHGTPVSGGQHSNSFDLDEHVIINAARFYAALYEEIINERGLWE